MPATSLSGLITELVATVASSVDTLREHHLSEQAMRRLLREAQAVDLAGRQPGAPLSARARLRQECPEQAGDDERGVAVDHPVAHCASAVR